MYALDAEQTRACAPIESISRPRFCACGNCPGRPPACQACLGDRRTADTASIAATTKRPTCPGSARPAACSDQPTGTFRFLRFICPTTSFLGRGAWLCLPRHGSRRLSLVSILALRLRLQRHHPEHSLFLGGLRSERESIAAHSRCLCRAIWQGGQKASRPCWLQRVPELEPQFAAAGTEVALPFTAGLPERAGN